MREFTVPTFWWNMVGPVAGPGRPYELLTAVLKHFGVTS
jgi:hypothetical protein